MARRCWNPTATTAPLAPRRPASPGPRSRPAGPITSGSVTTVRPASCAPTICGSGCGAGHRRPKPNPTTPFPVSRSPRPGGSAARSARRPTRTTTPCTLNAGDSVAASLDLDPERDGVEWNGQLGLGPFGDPAIILAVNDAGAAHAGLRGALRDRQGRGDLLRRRQRAVGGTTFGTYHLSVSVRPAATPPSTTYTSTDVPVSHPDRTRGGHLDHHHPRRHPDWPVEGRRRPDPQLHGGPGRHADVAGRQHRGAVHRRRLHHGWRSRRG